MMWEPEIEQWMENNRTLIDSGDFDAITKKFDSDCTDNKLICSFEDQDRFCALLGYLMEKPFVIAPEMGIEIILYLDCGDGTKYQVYSAPDIKNYEKINSLEDSKLKEFVARAFSQDRNIPLDITRKMVEKASIDRSNA